MVPRSQRGCYRLCAYTVNTLSNMSHFVLTQLSFADKLLLYVKTKPLLTGLSGSVEVNG